MTKRCAISAALAALLSIGSTGRPAAAAQPPSPRGPIAVVGDRKVEEADIRRAAAILHDDPLRTSKPAEWRKKLLDLCIDRELLAMEAERRGILNDHLLKTEVETHSAEILYEEIASRVLIPKITPTSAQIDEARASGLYRRLRVSYILTAADDKGAAELYRAMKAGASFDSLAPLWSLYPSPGGKAEIGWRFVGQLHKLAQPLAKSARPGDLLGPYRGTNTREYYKVLEVGETDDAGIRAAMMAKPLAQLRHQYEADLLKKYHFAADTNQVKAVLFATATETVRSIVASLGPDGTRPKKGVRPAIGVLASVDGDEVSFRDLAARPTLLVTHEDGKTHIHDGDELEALCAYVFMPRLIARDAREAGIDKDLAVVRRLRLLRDETATRAMVRREAAAPRDSVSLQAFLDAHPDRYRRPPARRSLVVAFTTRDSALEALRAWNGIGFSERMLDSLGYRAQPQASALTLFADHYQEMPLFETDPDPLSIAVRALGPGQISQPVDVPNGSAMALVRAREPARPWTYSEIKQRLAVDLVEETEDAWVQNQLERLRAATPAQRVASRLEAVRLGQSPGTGGKRR